MLALVGMDHVSKVPTVTSMSFTDEVLRAEHPVLVDVTAAWCPPCRAAEPVVAQLARDHADRLKVVRVDGEESPDLVAQLQVRGFPTFVLFDGGRELRRQAGFRSSRSLDELVGVTADTAENG